MMSPILKIAIVGGITAIVVDHYFKPTLRKTVGI